MPYWEELGLHEVARALGLQGCLELVLVAQGNAVLMVHLEVGHL